LLFLDQRVASLAEGSRAEFAVMADDQAVGKVLCCDLPPEDIDALEYVAYIDHVPSWPPKFLDAVAFRLSAELAFAIKKDEPLAERQMKRYRTALEDASALAFNAEQRGPEPMTPSRAARGG
jgi:hypothetical protein